MSEKKSTVGELKQFAESMKRQRDAVKEKGSEIAENLITTTVAGVTSTAAGFADAALGKDVGNGVRRHMVGKVPTAFGAGVIAMGAAAFGFLGQKGGQLAGYATGTGGICSYGYSMGYEQGVDFRTKSEKEEDGKKTELAKTGTK
jgi:hypothetical protein